MRMRNYLKKKTNNVVAPESLPETGSMATNLMITKKTKKILCIAALIVIVPTALALIVYKELNKIMPSEETIVQLTPTPVAETSGKKGVISIPAGVVKSNPFLPYRDLGGTAVNDVPAYNLVEPPDMVEGGSDAARVMDTIVSGILYDKYSPSAILNIEGNDYLVKKGDVVNNYKIVSILQDSVTVKLGANTYKAGIGEILTEGELNRNEVSNLSKKFGGER